MMAAIVCKKKNTGTVLHKQDTLTAASSYLSTKTLQFSGQL